MNPWEEQLVHVENFVRVLQKKVQGISGLWFWAKDIRHFTVLIHDFLIKSIYVGIVSYNDCQFSKVVRKKYNSQFLLDRKTN